MMRGGVKKEGKVWFFPLLFFYALSIKEQDGITDNDDIGKRHPAQKSFLEWYQYANVVVGNTPTRTSGDVYTLRHDNCCVNFFQLH